MHKYLRHPGLRLFFAYTAASGLWVDANILRMPEKQSDAEQCAARPVTNHLRGRERRTHGIHNIQLTQKASCRFQRFPLALHFALEWAPALLQKPPKKPSPSQ